MKSVQYTNPPDQLSIAAPSTSQASRSARTRSPRSRQAAEVARISDVQQPVLEEAIHRVSAEPEDRVRRMRGDTGEQRQRKTRARLTSGESSRSA